VKWLKDAVDFAESRFNAQVTTAMPLQAVLKILSDSKSETSNPVASGILYGDKIKILTRNDFRSFSKIKANDITDEYHGYSSLLTSYYFLAEFSNPKKAQSICFRSCLAPTSLLSTPDLLNRS